MDGIGHEEAQAPYADKPCPDKSGALTSSRDKRSALVGYDKCKTHAPFICSLTGLLSALFVALAGLAQGYRDGLLLWLARLHLGFDV